MSRKTSLIRLSVLVAGLGVGAVVAQIPVAGADSSSEWWSSIDSLASGLPAVSSDTNLAISFDGLNLVDDGTAVAHTTSGQFGLAIAFGAGATANAEGGTGNFALADGTNAVANAGSLATNASSNDDNTAIDIGTNSSGATYAGAYAGNGSLDGFADDAAGSSHNTAIDIGNNTGAGLNGAYSGSGGLAVSSGAGNGDTAYDFGNNSGVGDASIAVHGNHDYAGLFGNASGTEDTAYVNGGSDDSAVAVDNYTADFRGAEAGPGDSNYAFVDGPENSSAQAGFATLAGATGGHNIAFVLDPFGTSTAPDSAIAGASNSAASGSNDLAEVLFTHGDAAAHGGDLLYDIITLFGNASNVAAG